jgi:hypothetical protein
LLRPVISTPPDQFIPLRWYAGTGATVPLRHSFRRFLALQ